ncbi:hypothetical protein HNQ54_001711 [Anaerocolumna cellulosilytica]|nr:hypothetical protein [Anaerocolumna cellulosilytica]
MLIVKEVFKDQPQEERKKALSKIIVRIIKNKQRAI